MQPIFSIAIDGPAGAGKSTIARKLAERLGAIYLDTGAMYRTVALYMHDSDIQGSESIARAINDPKIEVQFQNGEQHMLLNGVDVNERLRSPEASMMASRVSAVPAVRERLVALQREIAAGHAVVMDGRDIGTKVLPNATLKVYLTASCEVRADRRFAELKEDNPTLTREQVLADIVERDYNDAHREASPLYQASDAVRIDTSNMNQDQVVAAIIDLLLKALRA
ncbi:MAG: (d)CMP kinase [Candidatus Faecivicinus sp.]|nr:(d)CMP kinase [Candidatus Faecivicinus sp.]